MKAKYWFPAKENMMWNMHSTDFVKLLGVTSTKLPKTAISPREVLACENKMDGTVRPVNVTIWADEAPANLGRKNVSHRVKCKCPGCGDIMSAGRLFQHRCNAERRSK